MDYSLKLQILKGSQQEHDKILKDFAYIYGHNHPRVVVMTEERNRLTDEINKILNKIKQQTI